MFLMLVITVVLFVFVDVFIVSKSAEDIVVNFVWENADRIIYKDSQLDLSEIDDYDNGAYFAVFSDDTTLLSGSFPEEFRSDEVSFHSGVLSSVHQGDTDYFVYDLQWDVASYPLLLRGIIPASITHDKMTSTIILAVFWLLLIIFLGVYGADYISKRTFKPIKALTDTAASISSSDNLSQRISLEHSSEEMVELADTFNSMFAHLEKSFEAEKKFVSDASHELRTPTTVILAECARARKKASTKEDFDFSLDIIEEQSNKMAHMISQLLSMTRLEQGSTQVKMQKADFSSFVAACCDEFIPVDDRGITLSTSLDPGITLAFDPGLMSRVIQNLLENAYKYGRNKGTILVSLKKHGTNAFLYVVDNGIGISDEDQQHIFKRFWQADPSRNEDHGVGLGLSMVKQICEYHGGSISVISAPGNGSTFIVTLPVK